MSYAQNRKPVQLERVGGQSKRDGIWAEIRQQRTFTVRSLQNKLTEISNSAIRSYCQGLVAATYLNQYNSGEVTAYTLIKDCGVDAPRVRKDGSEVMQGRGNENMWRTMKILKVFTWFDLKIAASTDEVVIKDSSAQHYVETLCKASYLICIHAATTERKAVYKFQPRKNTGVQPPMIQRGGHLYDPNLGKVVYQHIAKTREVLEADWLAVLRAECEKTSQSAVSKKLGYSPAVVNQVLKSTYKGDVTKVEAAVRGCFMNEVVDCPVVGEIATHICLNYQKLPFAAINPLRVQLYKACRNGCPHSKL